MPFTHFSISEENIIRLIQEFCSNRKLHIAELNLERETGIINGDYSDDILFLRQLILDGQWDDVLDFIQPLDALPTFDAKRFKFLILRQKFIELLCIRNEASKMALRADSKDTVDEIVMLLGELELLAPNKDVYSDLCLLLTTPRLNDHILLKNWNPSASRYQCFLDIYPLIPDIMQLEKNKTPVSINDRLLQLIIKGILYESCVNFCKIRSSSNPKSIEDLTFSPLLDGTIGFSDSDLSLLSWLQTLPFDTFTIPFEQRSLTVDVVRFEKPPLETSWSEHMLITPIKPKRFPHSAMPFTRPKSAADMMSRSLISSFEGLSCAVDHHDLKSTNLSSFHLTGLRNDNNLMNVSVDRLFGNDPYVSLSNETKFNMSSSNEPTVLLQSNYDNKETHYEFQIQKQKLYDSIKDRNDVVKTNNLDNDNIDSGAQIQKVNGLVNNYSTLKNDTETTAFNNSGSSTVHNTNHDVAKSSNLINLNDDTQNKTNQVGNI